MRNSSGFKTALLCSVMTCLPYSAFAASTIISGAVSIPVAVSGDDDLTLDGTASLSTGKKKAITITDANGAVVTVDQGASVISKDDPIHGEATAAPTGAISITNSGTLESTDGGQGIDLDDVTQSSSTTITNTATGKIIADDADGIRPGSGATVINSGEIYSNGAPGDSHDGIDFQDYSGSVENKSGGVISGERHGITSSTNVDVVNEADASITGRNGSGVGSDGTGSVVNYGTITGAYDGSGTGDGDGVDIDGYATVTNYGLIQALGAAGYKADGRANGAEGLALTDGGIVYNASTGVITSVLEGITACCSLSNTFTITNDGLIHGDDHAIGLSGISTIKNTGSLTGGNEGIDLQLNLDGSGSISDVDNYGKISGGYNAVYVSSGSRMNLTVHEGSTLSGNLAIDGTLQLSTPDDYTVTSNIVNAGNVIIAGTGSITLAGNNTYTGGTSIIGTGIGGVASFGSGDIDIVGKLVIDQATDAVMTNNLSGSGTFEKTGAGNLTLNPATDLTGNILIEQGTLRGAAASLGTAAVTDNSTLALDQATDATLMSTLAGAGDLIKTGAGNLTLAGTSTMTGRIIVNEGQITGTTSSLTAGELQNNATVTLNQDDDGTLRDALSGTGNYVKTGSGNVTLAGTNTGTGSFDIRAGALTGTAGSFGNGTIHNDATLILDQTNDGSLASAIDGTGDLVKTGSATVTLASANTYTGSTVIEEGALAGTANSFGKGPITDNSTLILQGAGAETLANQVSGTGSVITNGDNITLAAGNTYAGGTTILGGQLTGDSTSLGSGAIRNDGTLVLAQISDGTLSNAISGDGDFVKTGLGNLTLTGKNDSTGTTTIEAGVLTGTVNSLGKGTVVDNATLTITYDGDSAFTSQLSGSGALVTEGTGRLALSGINTLQGPITIRSGILAADVGNLGSGAINNQGTIELDQSENGALTNVVSGTGDLVKVGGGTLLIALDEAYTGVTQVNAGTLNVTGSIAGSAVDVASNATLTGTGTVGTTSIASGGTLDTASNGIGTQMTVNGDLNMASGASYVAVVGSDDVASKVDVMGTAHIAGSSLNLQIEGNSVLPAASRYQILSAAGGVDGSFDKVSVVRSNPYYFLSPDISYTQDAAWLTMQRNNVSFASAAGTRNEHGVATALDSMVGGSLIDTVEQMSRSQAGKAYNVLSGEIHASARTAMIENAFYVRNAALDRLDTADCIGGISVTALSAQPVLRAARRQG